MSEKELTLAFGSNGIRYGLSSASYSLLLSGETKRAHAICRRSYPDPS